ncbi:MAG: pantothenate kinase [Gloeotrichia echinulata IR180]
MKPHNDQRRQQNIWLALEIGNSRLHWALFIDTTLDCTWDTDHLSESVIQQLSQSHTLDDFLPHKSSGGVGKFVTGGQVLASELETSGSELETSGSEHETSGSEHETSGSEHETSGSELETSGSELETSGSELETSGSELETSGSEHETSHSPIPIFLASVVPSQTALWQNYPHVRVINLDQIPLQSVYPTLGIDRALALWGAGKTWGFPMLVIDAGTAMTFTGADANQCLVGGAILPGLGLQLATLGQNTAQLPLLDIGNFASLPPRFALNTAEAIQSGVIYTVIAGIKDFIVAWWDLFPSGNIAIKGGDRTLLLNYLQTLYPEIATRLIVEPNLIFWGMREIVRS